MSSKFPEWTRSEGDFDILGEMYCEGSDCSTNESENESIKLVPN
jgi:hypothetical protein